LRRVSASQADCCAAGGAGGDHRRYGHGGIRAWLVLSGTPFGGQAWAGKSRARPGASGPRTGRTCSSRTRGAPIARVRVPAGDFRGGDMFALPFADDRFDVATSFNGIWKGCEDALREARRVVRALAAGGLPGRPCSMPVTTGSPRRCAKHCARCTSKASVSGSPRNSAGSSARCDGLTIISRAPGRRPGMR
jgi:SAM-dependent methyltransferase